MAIDDPTRDEVRSAAAALGLDLDEAACDSYLAMIAGNAAAYRALDAMTEPLPESRGGDRSWQEPGEDPLNAWVLRMNLRTRDDGPLAGRTVVVKDNVSVAGVPMTGGSSILRGFVPDTDATIVTRLLDAGATITGRSRCEYFSLSGGSHTSDGGPVRNPHRPDRSAGGSSSGSGALVASGAVDLAIGGDQGGSIRIPSCWCGVYGMKPTYGLVPYTGVMSIESAVDHTGPMTADVTDNALMLEVLAGADGLDPRQSAPQTHAYTAALTGDCRGLRVGVVREGFGTPVSEPDVDQAVRQALDALAKLGAEVAEVSVPAHADAPTIFTPVLVEGGLQQMLSTNGMGANGQGHYASGLIAAMSGWRERSGEFSESLKATIIAGELFRRRYGGAYYAKAMNLVRHLRAAYDDALTRFDLLAMPTLPMKATPLPPKDAPRELIVQRALEMIGNTSPFNLTGHPAMNVPCAMRDGLPVGLMLVGRKYDEPSIYRAAYAFEQAGDWTAR
ncbi:MAG: amidase [Streptosporangiales bacterium]|nr:amidase [Streptosporangiales bacterium]